MAHQTENANPLRIERVTIRSAPQIVTAGEECGDVCVLLLPARHAGAGELRPEALAAITELADGLGSDATLVTVGDSEDLVAVHAHLADRLRYQLWIAVKRAVSAPAPAPAPGQLPSHHFGALIHSRYDASLRHARMRVGYDYCPACDKTTRDYGGKKHTYHAYGTLLSDVWRDIAVDLDGDLSPVLQRLSDLFGIPGYSVLRVIDARNATLHEASTHTQLSAVHRPAPGRPATSPPAPSRHSHAAPPVDQVIAGDCLEQLRRLPDDSIDFAFADPPYNLQKKYTGYGDDLDISRYFDWCDQWLSEMARVLRPGRTCAVLNIPLYGIRHFLHLQKLLRFQNWIAWDALSLPVRLIMPAHYALLCFSKGRPRPLPGLHPTAQASMNAAEANPWDTALLPLGEGYCLRQSCIAGRHRAQRNDRGPLTDLFWDTHRLKHNTRRVDHPCQLPPRLMYRLIGLFTEPGEIVLDPFNGAGTTTLSAHQMGRRYLGFERSDQYAQLARQRHQEIAEGLDPFRKADRVLTAKNSRVQRIKKQRYEIPKRTLQLEVKRIAHQLGRLPTRADMIAQGGYPIDYYDRYFQTWAQVCAAARTTGMSEARGKTTDA